MEKPKKLKRWVKILSALLLVGLTACAVMGGLLWQDSTAGVDTNPPLGLDWAIFSFFLMAIPMLLAAVVVIGLMIAVDEVRRGEEKTQ